MSSVARTERALGVWVVMMAAMMLPSALPTVVVYARLARDRSPVAPLVFAAAGVTLLAATGLLGSRRPGSLGALRMGRESGALCAGCCWALMASLFALGIMSVAWMASVAAIVAVEKLLPWDRLGSWSAASVLVALGVLLFVAPHTVVAM